EPQGIDLQAELGASLVEQVHGRGGEFFFSLVNEQSGATPAAAAHFAPATAGFRQLEDGFAEGGASGDAGFDFDGPRDGVGIDDQEVAVGKEARRIAADDEDVELRGGPIGRDDEAGAEGERFGEKAAEDVAEDRFLEGAVGGPVANELADA